MYKSKPDKLQRKLQLQYFVHENSDELIISIF